MGTLELKAPFEGDVLVVNTQPGDSASPTAAALTLANRSHPSVQEARRLLQGDKLGKVYGVELHIVADQTRLKDPTYHKSWRALKARAGGGFPFLRPGASDTLAGEVACVAGHHCVRERSSL